jgi:ribosomal protein L40E
VNSDEGAPGPTAADRQFQKLVCPICGAVLIGVHCKLICENCGYREDCSDLF